MKDLFPGTIGRDEFQRWLDGGHARFAIQQEEKIQTVLSRLEKKPSVDYLYRIASDPESGVSWDNSMLFCGVYDKDHGALYLAKDSLSIFTGGKSPLVSEVGPSMADEISGRIKQLVEDTIGNDRNNLSVQEITGWREMRDLQYYQKYGARDEALACFFSGDEPDGAFHSGYTLGELPEAAFIAYVRDPEGFIQTEAEQYIKINQEKFLQQFQMNDALLAEYQAIAQDTGSAVHRMKAITGAVKDSGAKTVTVTIQKDGTELTFKTAADSLTGHKSYYSTYDIPAPDRREFERLFGRNADYTAEDITRITYGKKTIYEAAPVQTENMVRDMEMGGM